MRPINDINATCGNCVFFDKEERCCIALRLETRVKASNNASFCLSYEPIDRKEDWCAFSDIEDLDYI